MERSIKPEAALARLSDAHLIDVRRKADLEASGEKLPGAAWHDPQEVAEWAKGLPRDRPVMLYCVHGRSVSNSVVDALRTEGLDACFIEGGIEGWKVAGGEVEPQSPAPDAGPAG